MLGEWRCPASSPATNGSRVLPIPFALIFHASFAPGVRPIRLACAYIIRERRHPLVPLHHTDSVEALRDSEIELSIRA
jgi:hypothetical protein